MQRTGNRTGSRGKITDPTNYRETRSRGTGFQHAPTRGKITAMNGFDVFQIYLGLKLHFTKSNYDYFKFNGKTNTKPSTFLNRKDRHFFDKLARVHKKDVFGFLVSNFVERGDLWVGDTFDDSAETIFTEWKKRFQSLRVSFSDDCSTIFNEADMLDIKFDDIFKFEDGRHPLIMRMHLQGRISIESFIIMNQILHFFVDFDAQMTDDIMWKELRGKCLNYEPFLPTKNDTQPYKDIMRKTAQKNGFFS